MSSVNTSSKPSRSQLPPGTAVGDRLRVERWEKDYFVLTARNGQTIGWALGWTLVVLAYFGLPWWMKHDRPSVGTDQALRWLNAAMESFITWGMVAIWLGAIAYLGSHLGTRYTFDNEQRTIRRNRLKFANTRVWDAADLGAVVLRIVRTEGVTSGSFRLRPSTSELLVLEVTVEDDDDRSVGSIRLTQIETDDPRAVDVVTIAGAIAKMFSLRVVVDGIATRACPELQSALNRHGRA